VPISRRLLDDGEEVLVDLRPHWLFLFGPLVCTLVAVAAAVTVAVAFPKAPLAVAWLLAAAVALPALWLAFRLARWFATSLVVTSERLVLRTGVMTRDLVQIRLARIAEVHARQGLLQRLLGTGRLVVEVYDGARPLFIDDVRRPRALQRVINRRLDELAEPRDAGAAPPPAPRAERPDDTWPDRPVARWEAPTPPRGMPVTPTRGAGSPSAISEQLIQLDELRRRGIVSEQEFETKKLELLGRL
jgi:membrane protein YdbS with pleckstrin-like domain